jgi:hypothetical protein
MTFKFVAMVSTKLLGMAIQEAEVLLCWVFVKTKILQKYHIFELLHFWFIFYQLLLALDYFLRQLLQKCHQGNVDFSNTSQNWHLFIICWAPRKHHPVGSSEQTHRIVLVFLYFACTRVQVNIPAVSGFKLGSPDPRSVLHWFFWTIGPLAFGETCTPMSACHQVCREGGSKWCFCLHGMLFFTNGPP